ncbi:hypothetical protein PsYK624_134970 [Phanerochaete sordida]|uniref:Uncharacterized protein n=1 Tax=Phanerochaete sordida TaxID=48140 RepID=A0A9P3GLN4_9APHY|nr:hypothetical protein PsYK624_134970 [Phanerochaete sordida]
MCWSDSGPKMAVVVGATIVLPEPSPTSRPRVFEWKIRAACAAAHALLARYVLWHLGVVPATPARAQPTHALTHGRRHRPPQTRPGFSSPRPCSRRRRQLRTVPHTDLQVRHRPRAPPAAHADTAEGHG